MPVAPAYYFYRIVSASSTGFTVQGLRLQYPPYPDWADVGSVSGAVVSPAIKARIDIYNVIGNTGVGSDNYAGSLGAYSIGGELRTFQATLHTGAFVTASTGITVPETGATYSLTIGDDPVYVITSSSGMVFTSTDFVSWVQKDNIQSGAPGTPAVSVSQADIDTFNAAHSGDGLIVTKVGTPSIPPGIAPPQPAPTPPPIAPAVPIT
jgi:hypothetical protein